MKQIVVIRLIMYTREVEARKQCIYRIPLKTVNIYVYIILDSLMALEAQNVALQNHLRLYIVLTGI